jgi:hypothetical protein
MNDKFIYVVMEDGEFSACFATLVAAQDYCSENWEGGINLIIIEIPVRDILKFER